MPNKSLGNVARNVLIGEAEQLAIAADRISEKMEAVCKIISDHSGKIVISGMGKSGLIAQKIASTLCSIGNKAVFLHPAEAVHGDLGIYAPGDPTILISKSGATDEIVRLIPIYITYNYTTLPHIVPSSSYTSTLPKLPPTPPSKRNIRQWTFSMTCTPLYHGQCCRRCMERNVRGPIVDEG